jgi:hypothetical protein
MPLNLLSFGSLSTAFTMVSRSAYSAALKMETIYFSKMSIDFQRTTQRYVPEDSILYNHRCENLKSCLLKFIFLRFRICRSG